MLAMRSMRGGGNVARRGTVGESGHVRSIHSPAACTDRLAPDVFQPRQPVPGGLSVCSHIVSSLRYECRRELTSSMLFASANA
jgi:hypothetical protein